MKNNNGLKGVTDAMQYCKSMMKSKGGSIMQPVKKYELGGMTGDPGDEDDPTKKRKCKQGQCGGKLKSFVSNLFSNDRDMTTHRSNSGKKNNPSSKRHRIRL